MPTIIRADYLNGKIFNEDEIFIKGAKIVFIGDNIINTISDETGERNISSTIGSYLRVTTSEHTQHDFLLTSKHLKINICKTT